MWEEGFAGARTLTDERGPLRRRPVERVLFGEGSAAPLAREDKAVLGAALRRTQWLPVHAAQHRDTQRTQNFPNFAHRGICFWRRCLGTAVKKKKRST